MGDQATYSLGAYRLMAYSLEPSLSGLEPATQTRPTARAVENHKESGARSEVEPKVNPPDKHVGTLVLD